MGKLFKFLKPRVGAVLAIVAVLIIQAYCDLSLPGYTSDIVNVGIQQGGIDSAIPEQIAKDDMEKLLLFVSKDDQKIVMDAYTLDSKTYKKDAYVLKDDMLKDEDKEENEASGKSGQREPHCVEPAHLLVSHHAEDCRAGDERECQPAYKQGRQQEWCGRQNGVLAAFHERACAFNDAHALSGGGFIGSACHLLHQNYWGKHLLADGNRAVDALSEGKVDAELIPRIIAVVVRHNVAVGGVGVFRRRVGYASYGLLDEVARPCGTVVEHVVVAIFAVFGQAKPFKFVE